MGHKWYELPKWGTQEDPNRPNGHTNADDLNIALAERRKPDSAPLVALSRPPAEPTPETSEAFECELLSMEDVYRAAGIFNPRRGYSINKIVEMLHSEHMRGLSREMKRAAVLMALDAAEVSIDEVLRDAKVRQDAIDAYESEQRQQVEAEWARKAEENTQIQAELDLVKARYAERLRRNLDGIAREKATFANWVEMKKQESRDIAEAVELCLAPAATGTNTPIESVAHPLTGIGNSKPV